MRKKSLVTVILLPLVLALVATYLFGFSGRASCDAERWSMQEFDAGKWRAAESKSRHIFAKSLIGRLSRADSRFTRSQIIDLLGRPDNEDHSTFELEYFLGETRFCPLPYNVFLKIGFAADGSNKASIHLD
jgi:hypothetical protein